MIKMILADDEPVITRGIRKLIDWEQLGIQIIGEYEDGKSAFAAILRDQPEIALLDISMPGMSGVDIIPGMSWLAMQDTHHFYQWISGIRVRESSTGLRSNGLSVETGDTGRTVESY